MADVLLLVVACGLPSSIEAQTGTHELRSVAEGVYAAIRVGDPAEASNGNVLIIVNPEDVVVVDATLSPEDAERIVRMIRSLTPNPVRYVINTHWHDDHVNGNMVFRDAFPGVEFIAHPFTRDTVAIKLPAQIPLNRERYPGILETLEERLRTGLDRDGSPLSEERRRLTETNVRTYRWFIDQLQRLEIVPATLTVTDTLVLHRGERTIRILHLGHGNTAGDLVVHLPREGVLATGDLVVHPIPFSFGSFPRPWVDTLERLKALGATRIVPGHGEIMEDHSYIDRVQRLLRYVSEEAASAAARDLTLTETRAAIDLAPFRQEFAGDDAIRRIQFDQFFAAPAVERAWLEARALATDGERRPDSTDPPPERRNWMERGMFSPKRLPAGISARRQGAPARERRMPSLGPERVHLSSEARVSWQLVRRPARRAHHVESAGM